MVEACSSAVCSWVSENSLKGSIERPEMCEVSSPVTEATDGVLGVLLGLMETCNCHSKSFWGSNQVLHTFTERLQLLVNLSHRHSFLAVVLEHDIGFAIKLLTILDKVYTI